MFMNSRSTRTFSSVLATCTLAIAATAFVSAPLTTFAHDSAKPGAATNHSAQVDHSKMSGMDGKTNDAPKSGAATNHSQMDHSKMSGMDGKTMHSMSMTGDVDYDFAVNMRKHHQMAVIMSQKELDKGKNPQLKQMAKDIIAVQKKEIAMLDKWLATNKAVAKAN